MMVFDVDALVVSLNNIPGTDVHADANVRRLAAQLVEGQMLA